jgi:rSAM-associated Gly-rich repeat protein
MTRRNRIARALAVILPAGVLGASVALASASADTEVAATQVAGAGQGVAARLEAIRSGVGAIAGLSDAKGQPDPDPTTVAWWGNAGFGPWHLGWGNGGWGNGGWHNGGWGNWHNGWHNGGWGNWHNGWHNYWHNW